jgi:hypothetical protein
VVTGEGVQIDAFGFHLAGVEGVHAVVEPAGTRTFSKGCRFVMVWYLVRYGTRGLSTVTRIRLELVTCSSDHVVRLLSWHRNERRATHPKRMCVLKHPVSN